MLTLMNIISDHLSDLWWCSMGLKALCVVGCNIRKFTLRLHSLLTLTTRDHEYH